MIRLLVLCGSIILTSCAANKKAGQQQSYETIAYKEFNVSKDVAFTLNDNEDYVLATHKEDNPSVIGGGVVKGLVIHIEGSEIVFKKTSPGGSFDWISTYELKVVTPPGMTEGDQSIDDYTSIFNVQTGAIYQLNARER